ncbi:MAG TPA: 2-dehydropantoate 2-reductase [Gaiellaceae bacterium]|nr:2-dehydropantoate 2-reductase [Gaiellaceae bacterium]
MTVAVLGPGAIGGCLAVRLATAGEDVVCVARHETAGALARDGLTLVAHDREVTASVEAVEALDRPVELLLVTVKATQLEGALDRVHAEPELVLPLLNGIEHMAVLRERFRRARAATIGRVEAYRESPTRIVQRREPLVTVAGDPVPGPLERAGIDVRPGGSEADVLWEKLARLAPLALLTSLTGLPLGELRSDPRLRTLLEEAVAVAVADGAWTSVGEQWGIIESMPEALTTSTARDVAAGRPSELDAIAGAVVRAGGRLGVPTPTFEEVLAACPA